MANIDLTQDDIEHILFALKVTKKYASDLSKPDYDEVYSKIAKNVTSDFKNLPKI